LLYSPFGEEAPLSEALMIVTLGRGFFVLFPSSELRIGATDD
jgi:hypothetical protein